MLATCLVLSFLFNNHMVLVSIIEAVVDADISAVF